MVDAGRLRDKFDVDPGIDEVEAERLALASPKLSEVLAGAMPAKVIVRPPKLVNIVLR